MALGMSEQEVYTSVTSQMKGDIGSLDVKAVERVADVIARVILANNHRIEDKLHAAGLNF